MVGERGQSTVEYLLLLFVILSVYLMVSSQFKQLNITARMLKPLKEDYAYTYKYGHPKAKGYDEGNPSMHPRIYLSDEDQSNFRIFITPQVRDR